MSLLDLLKKVKDEVEKKADEISAAVSQLKDQQDDNASTESAPTVNIGVSEEVSFYDAIPAEENQYNFGGSFLEYFDKVFREEFPEYSITRKEFRPGRSYVYTFELDGKIALQAEIMSENCSANSFRKQCLTSGTPYVRFYFDHESWWNTRAYVAG